MGQVKNRNPSIQYILILQEDLQVVMGHQRTPPVFQAEESRRKEPVHCDQRVQPSCPASGEIASTDAKEGHPAGIQN